MKTVLITGTTSGIGYELANIFSSKGYNLITVSRNEKKLIEQKDNLLEKGAASVEYMAYDLSKNDAPEYIFQKLKEMKLSVDILVNNAGFDEAGAFIKTNANKEIEMISVHIGFTTKLTKLILPEMISNGFGKILNLGSTAAYIPCPLSAVYAATKAYILHFSNSLFYELKDTGVSITTLCPGPTKTLFAEKAGIEKSMLFKISVMDASKVAVAGYKALMKGKRIVIPGFYNKFIVFISRSLPMSIVGPLAKKMWQ